ncbi:MAG: helix-turn-helix domain-containing protein [Synergistaceae bacterium]|nr:helix-turn-helix domain-containing protein [Synergistaceae bacterium]
MLPRLKEYRKALKMTQSELASKMNTTRRSIIRWENGQSKPSLERLQRLADIMGCATDDFCQE